MAIATYTDYEEKMRSLHQTVGYKTFANARSNLASGWRAVANIGNIPSTPEVCTMDTVGAYNYEDMPGLPGTSFVIARTSMNISAGGGIFIVADRLSHQGGLDGTNTSAQTTNLPTTALTRYTNGVGVMCAYEIYTAIGATSTTISGSYTNSDGVSGRTFKDMLIGATAHLAVGTFRILPLQDGDLGVRSVESITLAGTTGTVGNFGITLFRPLFMNHPVIGGIEGYGTNTFNNLIGGGGQFAPIQEDACLFLLHYGASTGIYSFAINMMDIT